jgi:hypothetical protein
MQAIQLHTLFQWVAAIIPCVHASWCFCYVETLQVRGPGLDPAGQGGIRGQCSWVVNLRMLLSSLVAQQLLCLQLSERSHMRKTNTKMWVDLIGPDQMASVIECC